MKIKSKFMVEFKIHNSNYFLLKVTVNLNTNFINQFYVKKIKRKI